MSRAQIRLGAAGEDRAAAWYQARGYRVVVRNWRCAEGELDLICAAGSRLVVCEVKTRSSLAFCHPAEAVTPAKQRRIRGLASRWLADGGLGFAPSEIRFDVAAVVGSSIEVFEAAF